MVMLLVMRMVGQLPEVQTFGAVSLAAQLVSHAFSPSLQPPSLL